MATAIERARHGTGRFEHDIEHFRGEKLKEHAWWFGHYLAEAAGVFLIVLFGDAAIAAGVLFGAGPDLLTVALGWGLAVGLAVWANITISGAHFNPGVTLVMALRREFPWKHVVPYIVFQCIGGFAAAAFLDALYYHVIDHKLALLGVAKGAPGSQLIGMVFAPVTPNPGLVGIGPAGTAAKLKVTDGWNLVSNWQGAAGEFVATALLIIFILLLLDARNRSLPKAWAFPPVLALAVMMIVVVDGPASMASLNAARDLGPRFFMWIAGWKSMAFPGPRSDWWVTTIAPTVGAITGGYFYDFLIQPFTPAGKAPPEGSQAPATAETPCD
jgi:glycerol uptake facilitator protein